MDHWNQIKYAKLLRLSLAWTSISLFWSIFHLYIILVSVQGKMLDLVSYAAYFSGNRFLAVKKNYLSYLLGKKLLHIYLHFIIIIYNYYKLIPLRKIILFCAALIPFLTRYEMTVKLIHISMLSYQLTLFFNNSLYPWTRSEK